jgi:hypothetical protein
MEAGLTNRVLIPLVGITCMSYLPHKTKIQSVCPVAVKINQTKVHALDHNHWGHVTFDECGKKFAIGPNRIHGSRRTDEDCDHDTTVSKIVAPEVFRHTPFEHETTTDLGNFLTTVEPITVMMGKQLVRETVVLVPSVPNLTPFIGR